MFAGYGTPQEFHAVLSPRWGSSGERPFPDFLGACSDDRWVGARWGGFAARPFHSPRRAHSSLTSSTLWLLRWRWRRGRCGEGDIIVSVAVIVWHFLKGFGIRHVERFWIIHVPSVLCDHIMLSYRIAISHDAVRCLLDSLPFSSTHCEYTIAELINTNLSLTML